MKLLNTQIAVNLKLETKEELLRTVNLLTINNIINYIITEEVSTIGSYKLTGELTKSSIPSGYIVTIYTKDFKLVNVLNELLDKDIVDYDN